MADKNFSLRKPAPRPVKPAAPARPKLGPLPPPAKPVGGGLFADRQGLPLTPGEVVMTDGEKKDLVAAGWQPGQPIPHDFARRVGAIKDAMAAETGEALKTAAAGDHVLSVPPPVSVADLPASKQAELRAALEDYNRQVAETAAFRKAVGDPSAIPPSVMDAVKAAAAPSTGEVWTDSRQASASAPTPPPRTAPVAQPEPEPEDAVEVSRDDLLAFATKQFLGTEAAAFLKEYTYLGGRFAVVCRTIPVRWVDACWSQIRMDQTAGRIATVDDLWRTVYEYRMVLGLQSVNAAGRVVEVGAAVDDLMAAPYSAEYAEEPGGTVLPYLVKTLQEQHPLSSESVWRTIYNAWRAFDKLVGAMEKRLDDPNAFAAIGS